jgi:hypothetical protein
VILTVKARMAPELGVAFPLTICEIASSSLRDLASQAPSAYVIVLMKGSI